MSVLKTIIAISFLILVIHVGCSGKNSPVTPVYNPAASDQLPIIGLSNPDGQSSAIGLMGLYELNLDLQSMAGELISQRTNDIGESYIVSGASFFTISPCSDCLTIQSISLTDDGDIQLGMRLQHPFKPGDVSKPPSAVNRLDLDVFDVALVVVPLDQVSLDFTQTGTAIYDKVLGNNAGYTRELANVLADNTAMPYALVVDESQTLPSPTTWNKLGMGESKDFDVTFKIDQDTALAFNLYVTMGYGFSAKKAERMFPRYLNPEFNRKAAWKV
ncbi:hypothetical protein KKB99_04710, partial [bacterium]|nr:hypothetical protein [bacterium]MBU1025297.1 hypothetical protein [bacterium]